MSRKRHKPEEIVTKLRQVEVLPAPRVPLHAELKLAVLADALLSQ